MNDQEKPLRVLIAGLGNMGISHALAHHKLGQSQIVALVNRSTVDLPNELVGYPKFTSFHEALDQTNPDLVVVATYSDSHADYACMAMMAGAHVFVEKPLATTVEDAQRVVDCATRYNRKLVVGYILRHHPSWQRFVQEARKLGGPYVFRMNLNQQSTGETWHTHKALMQTTSPIVDCGVHYVDVMCQITDSQPIKVHGMGLRLSDEISEDMYNYGHFQVIFEDGSVGWYEAGWGPMMSEVAYFVKDLVSPNGAVSILSGMHPDSDDVEGHTRVGTLRVHKTGGPDLDIEFPGEPGHQELCDAEQAFMLRSINENLDLGRHMNDAITSLKVCLAADQSVRTGEAIRL